MTVAWCSQFPHPAALLLSLPLFSLEHLPPLVNIAICSNQNWAGFKLRVLTQNLWGLPVVSRCLEARVHAFAKTLGRYDTRFFRLYFWLLPWRWTLLIQ